MSEFKRQHWAAAVDQLFNVLRKNIIPLLILLFLGSRDSASMIFWYVLFSGLILSTITGVLGWFLFTYRLVGDELEIKKGIFIRKHLYLSKDRIQVIDLTEGLVQRIFGLVKLEIKTAGSGTEGATIRAISFTEANELRDELRKKHSSPLVLEDDEEDLSQVDHPRLVEDSWNITKKELTRAAITSGNFGLIASILGAVSGQLDSFINEENIDYLIEVLPGLNNVTLIITVVVFILALSYGLSFLGVIFNYSHFRVEKKENELHISSGLLERKHVTIPFNRIQAVRFVEGVLRQPFGYGMLFIESAGFEQNQKERSIVLAPYLSKDDLDDFFKRFLPDYHQVQLDVKPPKRALLKYLRRPNYLLALLLPISIYMFEYGWLLALVVFPLIYVGWLQYRDAGLKVNNQMIAIRSRTLARTSAYIRRNRIQVMDESVNLLQIRKKLSSLVLTAASGSKGLKFEVKDLDEMEVVRVRNWIISGVKEVIEL